MYLECIFQVGTKDLLEFRGEDKVALKHIIFFVTLAMFIVAKSKNGKKAVFFLDM